MPKYRRKPIIVEASQWFKDGDHPAVIHLKKGGCFNCVNVIKYNNLVSMSNPYVNSGDFIIKNEDGKYYTMEKNKFQKIYELMGLED